MNELKAMKTDDVLEKDDILIVTIPDSKNGKMRTFTITNEIHQNIKPIDVYKKFKQLRLSHTPHKYLFVNYRNEKCSTQVVGIHTLGKIPQLIATYLNLPNAKSYTGHAFRRTSASFLADTGCDVLALKQHGGWKSANVAEGYIESSINRKTEIASLILQGNSSCTNESTSTIVLEK